MQSSSVHKQIIVEIPARVKQRLPGAFEPQMSLHCSSAARCAGQAAAGGMRAGFANEQLHPGLGRDNVAAT
jgi:hypothetical protein